MQSIPDSPAQSGFVLLTTILVLALVTVAVFAAMRTSAVELQIAANEVIHQRAFFQAEAGIGHAVAILAPLFVQENAVGGDPGPTWNFAFCGPDRIAGGADDARGRGKEAGSFERGSRWLDVRQPERTGYVVTVWNNAEKDTGGDYHTDRDGLVWLRSDGAGPRGGRASIQVLLQGEAVAEHPAGYPAQAGGGAAASSSGRDRDPIVDFDLQMGSGVID